MLTNNWTRGKQPANTPPSLSTTPGLLHPVSIHQMAPSKLTSNCSSLLNYRSRKDERLSWPSWLPCSGRFTDITSHSSDAGQAQDRESSPAKDRRSTTVPRHQRCGVTCENNDSSCVILWLTLTTEGRAVGLFIHDNKQNSIHSVFVQRRLLCQRAPGHTVQLCFVTVHVMMVVIMFLDYILFCCTRSMRFIYKWF